MPEEKKCNNYITDQSYFTNNFNTLLNTDEENTFQRWLIKKSDLISRQLSKDLINYDLRGLFKDGGDTSAGHMPDKFKKPNHPSFSNESIYHGTPNSITGSKWVGGQWLDTGTSPQKPRK